MAKFSLGLTLTFALLAMLPVSENGKGAIAQPLNLLASFFSPQSLFPDLPESQGGVINVRDYGAVGDGVTDDTAAFQAALMRDQIANGSKILYIPNGTYVLSDTLRWPKGAHSGLAFKRTTMSGESQTGVTLKLADGAPGFDDRTNPKPVIDTGNNRANAFRNRIENLTLNTGRGNAGAIAIALNSNNGGGVFNVQLQAGDGGGLRGLDLSTPEVGPLLVQDLTVIGFETGINVGGGKSNAVHMENITLRNQGRVGIAQAMQVLTVRNLNSVNAVPVVAIESHGAMFSLMGATLEGQGTEKMAAITTRYSDRTDTTPGERASLQTFLIDVEQTGYASTGELYNCQQEGEQRGNLITLPEDTPSWNCGQPLGSSEAALFQLPVRDTPTLPPNLTGKVVVVTEPTGAAIQGAIDTPGVTQIFLANQTYQVDAPILIRGTVERITGMGARFNVESVQPMFRFVRGMAPVVMLERLEGASLSHESDRTLILQKSWLHDYTNTPQGTGDLFLADITVEQMAIQQQNVWARSLNVEGRPKPGDAKITNNGGKLWIFGLKTEKAGTIIATHNGQTEVFGGLIYINEDIPDTTPPQPQYLKDQSHLTVLTRSYLPGAIGYPVLIREIRNGKTQDLINPNRYGEGRFFYQGHGVLANPLEDWEVVNTPVTIPEPAQILAFLGVGVVGRNCRRSA